MARFGGVHAFGCNSAEKWTDLDEIWSTLSTLSRMALADFVRDWRSSDSWTAKRIYFVREATYDFTDFPSAKFHKI